MRRNLLHLVAAASLVLCVAAVALWVRGWFNGGVLRVYSAKHFYYVGVHSGQLEVHRFNLGGGRGAPPQPIPAPWGTMIASVRLWPVALVSLIGPRRMATVVAVATAVGMGTLRTLRL